ncbi:DUF1302 family protein [Thermosulfuriphilus sp.]
MRFFFSLLVLVILGLGSPCRAVSFDLPLEIKATFWARGAIDLKHDRRPEDRAVDQQTGTVELSWLGPGALFGKASLRIDRLAFHNDLSHEETDYWIWETYLGLQGEDWELRVGKQFVRWGKADEISLVDNVNPQDLRQLMYLRLEERKRPNFLIRYRHYFVGLNIEILFSPTDEAHERDQFGSDWANFDHLKEAIAHSPQVPSALKGWAAGLSASVGDHGWSLRRSEWGFRITGTWSQIDLGISYLNAHSRSPYPFVRRFPLQGFRVTRPTNPLADLLAQIGHLNIAGNEIIIGQPRNRFYGFEFETTWGDFGLRGEFLYQTDRVLLKEDLTGIRKPSWAYILGIDRTWPNGLYLNLQFLQQRILAWSEGILFEPKLDSSLFGRLSWPWFEDRLEIRLDVSYDLTNRMWYANPEVIYKINDNLHIFFGLHLIDGPPDTFLDLYDNNDDIYLGLKVIL